MFLHYLNSYDDKWGKTSNPGKPKTQTGLIRKRDMSQPPDVFSSIRPKSEHGLLEETFCVNDWQKEITRNYISSVSMFPTSSTGKKSQEVRSKENKRKTFKTSSHMSSGESHARIRPASGATERIVQSLSKIGDTSREKMTEFDEDWENKIDHEEEHQIYFSSESEESEEWKSNLVSDSDGDSTTGKETIRLRTEQNGESLFSKLPHWKRDLLKEAPRGLFSKRQQVKVNIAMSKAKRIQELDRMVVEHVYDVKEVAKRECRRRECNKLQLYSTLLLLKDTSIRTKFSDNPNWQ